MGASPQPRCQQDRGRVSGPYLATAALLSAEAGLPGPETPTPHDGADLWPPLSEADLGHPDRGQCGRQQDLGTDPPH